MEDKIRRFLEETFLFEFNDEVTRESDLFRQGLIDSFGYVQLISFLEGEFGIRYADEEMLSSVLVNLSGMVASVEAKVADLQQSMA